MNRAKDKPSTEYNLEIDELDIGNLNVSEVFDKVSFQKTLNQTIEMRNIMKNNAIKTQTKLRKDSDIRTPNDTTQGSYFKKDDKVFIRNLTRDKKEVEESYHGKDLTGSFSIQWYMCSRK